MCFECGEIRKAPFFSAKDRNSIANLLSRIRRLVHSSANQTLSFEQKKKLIKALFEQFPTPEPLADSITHIGDLETATLEIRQKVAESIERTANQLREVEQ
jgi:hypothetical protein